MKIIIQHEIEGKTEKELNIEQEKIWEMIKPELFLPMFESLNLRFERIERKED